MDVIRTVVKDRIVVVDGAVNLRDFGGYTGHEGRPVVRNRLFRSGTLHYITPEGATDFEDLNVALICDLRRADEKEHEPTELPNERLEIPIDPGSATEMRDRMKDGELDFDERVHFMTELTRELTRDHASEYEDMFASILGHQGIQDGGGFLVHCSAGKDRTGVAVALILHALGVPEEVIFQDYLFTNEAIDYEGFIKPRLVDLYEPNVDVSKELIMTIAGVREEYLRAAHDAMHDVHDSVEVYLRESIGLSQSDLVALRTRYLA